MLKAWRTKGAVLWFKSVALASVTLFVGFHAQPSYVLNQKDSTPKNAMRLMKQKYVPPPSTARFKNRSMSVSRNVNPLTSGMVKYLGTFEITWYSLKEGTPGGITSSGVRPQQGVTIACPSSIPFGAKLYIKGVGERVCQDRGGAIRGKHVDVFVNNDHTAIENGLKYREVIELQDRSLSTLKA